MAHAICDGFGKSRFMNVVILLGFCEPQHTTT